MQTQNSLDDERFLDVVPELEIRKFIEDNPFEPITEALLRTRDKSAKQAEYISLLEKELRKSSVSTQGFYLLTASWQTRTMLSLAR